MSTTTSEVADSVGARIAHLPPAVFTVPMSLAGVGLVGRRADEALGWGSALSVLSLWLAAASLLVVAAAYVRKLVGHPAAALADWRHPVRMCHFAAAPMALLLLAVALLPIAPDAAHIVWILGTLIYVVLMIAATSAWLRRAPADLATLNPTWFLPIVGPVLIAHAGVRLGYTELCWLIVGATVLAWIALQALLFYRLVFLPQLPERLQPSLAIQIGPAPLIFIALCELAPGLDPLGRVIYNAGAAIACMLAPRLVAQARPFLTLATFQMAWWAYSFPISALAAATFLYAERAGSAWHARIAGGLYVIVIAVTAMLLVRTITAARRGELLRAEA